MIGAGLGRVSFSEPLRATLLLGAKRVQPKTASNIRAAQRGFIDPAILPMQSRESLPSLELVALVVGYAINVKLGQ